MTEPAISPFASAAPALSAMGYSCLPLIPSSVTSHRGRGKCPGAFTGGRWSGLDKWQRRRETPLHGFELGLAMKAPGANVGVVLGTVARPGLHVIAVDVDAEDAGVVDAIVRCLPASPMAKRGAKGRTLFYAAPQTVTSRAFDDHRIPRDAGIPRRLVDILTGFATKQTVCPPSVHPDGPVYEWLAGPVAAAELPLFDDDAMTVLEETLQQFGYDPDAAHGGRGERKAYVEGDLDTTGDAFDVAKRAALANIGAWIHDVENVHGLRPARGGFEAVSLMRSSSSGQPLERRKRNLSIQRNGIRDFGTDETFSAIDLVAHHNSMTVGEALSFLEERLGLRDDSIVIDLRPPPEMETASLVLAERTSEAASSEKVSETETTIPNPVQGETHGAVELPAHLMQCPGLIGDIADWINRTAPCRFPAASFLTAIMLVGTAAGRKYAGPTDTGTHLYGMVLAPSGAGKAHPQAAARHLLARAGLERMDAPSSYMSASALVQHIGRSPASLCIADEVGELFAAMNAKGATSHERRISAVMREMFGINWGTYTSPGWASSNASATTPPRIHAPAFSFLGFSVPEAVWEAMQGADVTNGFLNRFIIVPAVSVGVEQDNPERIRDVPDDLVERLRDVAAVGGPLYGATAHGDMPSKPAVELSWDGGPKGDAATLFRELRTHCREHPSGEHLMKRTAEIAVRMATIQAIGRGSRVVTLDDMDWARNVALFSAESMIRDAAAYMSETEWQQKALSVLRIIRESPKSAITKTKLYLRLNHKYKTAEVKAIIEGLIEAGQVVGNSIRTGERGPPSMTYQAV